MTLVRWSPARELTTFQNDVDRLLEGFFRRGALRGDLSPIFAPPVDVEETADEFVMRADLPGISMKDVKVSVMGDTVTIRGERSGEKSSQDGSLHRVERSFGSFERSFTLGAPIRADKVKAQYKDGVLEVRVPKAEEARPREIEVQVAS